MGRKSKTPVFRKSPFSVDLRRGPGSVLYGQSGTPKAHDRETRFVRQPDGLTAQQQLKAITQRADLLQDKQTEIWFAQKAQLSQLGTCIFTVDQLSAEQADWLEGYFCTHILPLLTPFTLDEEHPFPFIPSGGLCMVFQLADSHFLVPIPDTLPRFVALPGTEGEYVTVDEMLQSFNRHIFAGESLAVAVPNLERQRSRQKGTERKSPSENRVRSAVTAQIERHSPESREPK